MDPGRFYISQSLNLNFVSLIGAGRDQTFISFNGGLNGDAMLRAENITEVTGVRLERINGHGPVLDVVAGPTSVHDVFIDSYGGEVVRTASNLVMHDVTIQSGVDSAVPRVTQIMQNGGVLDVSNVSLRITASLNASGPWVGVRTTAGCFSTRISQLQLITVASFGEAIGLELAGPGTTVDGATLSMGAEVPVVTGMRLTGRSTVRNSEIRYFGPPRGSAVSLSGSNPVLVANSILLGFQNSILATGSVNATVFGTLVSGSVSSPSGLKCINVFDVSGPGITCP